MRLSRNNKMVKFMELIANVTAARVGVEWRNSHANFFLVAVGIRRHKNVKTPFTFSSYPRKGERTGGGRERSRNLLFITLNFHYNPTIAS